MKVSLVWVKRAIVVVCVGLLIYYPMRWRASRQVVLQTESLLAKVSSRDWDGVKGMMAEDYGDRWGHNRGGALGDAMQVFGQFFSLHIKSGGEWKVEKAGDVYVVAAPVEVLGTGTAVAQMVMDTVRNAGGEYEFRWRKVGMLPWKWELVGVENESLPGEEMSGMF